MQSLSDLAVGGIIAVPPDAFLDLAGECESAATATGDARYSVLAEMFAGLATWWSLFGAVPTPLSTSIYDALQAGLPTIIRTTGAVEATARATALRDVVEELALPASDWHGRGYVRART